MEQKRAVVDTVCRHNYQVEAGFTWQRRGERGRRPGTPPSADAPRGEDRAAPGPQSRGRDRPADAARGEGRVALGTRGGARNAREGAQGDLSGPANIERGPGALAVGLPPPWSCRNTPGSRPPCALPRCCALPASRRPPSLPGPPGRAAPGGAARSMGGAWRSGLRLDAP